MSIPSFTFSANMGFIILNTQIRQNKKQEKLRPKGFQDQGKSRTPQCKLQARNNEYNSVVLIVGEIVKFAERRVTNSTMTQDIQKDIKNAGQNPETKTKTSKECTEVRPGSEAFNKAKVKAEDVAKA